MKLRDGFVTYSEGEIQLMVAAGNAQKDFSGLCKSNSTAAFIIDMLKKDVSREEIIEQMYKKFNATKEQISYDVDNIINKLKSINAIE